MSDTDTLTPEELAILAPDAPQPQPPAKTDAPETPEATPKPAAAVAETPKPVETPAPAQKPELEGPKGEPNAAFAAMRREIADLRRQLAANPPPQQPKPEAPKVPALDQDPVANLDTRVGSTEQAVRQMLEAENLRTAQTQVLTAYQADAARVAKANPEFTEAYNHWRDRTGAYLRHFNPAMEPAQVEAALNMHELTFAYNALRAEKSPGELILAAARDLGFAPKPKEPEKPAAPAETLTQQVARGQQLAANPIANGGAAPTPELTAATLAAMSDEDFAKVSERDWRRAMGG